MILGSFSARKIALVREDIGECSSSGPFLSIPSPSARLTLFSPASEADARDIISPSSNASCQLDPIPTRLLKMCVDVLPPVITRMTSSSRVSGSVPANWKIALYLKPLRRL